VLTATISATALMMMMRMTVQPLVV
jgi:hypothetical protein